MRSLGSRLNGNKEEVVQYVRTYGVLPAMEQYKVKSLDAMLRYLQKVAPGENFAMSKTETTPFSSPDAFDRLLEAMLRKFNEQNTKIESLAAENAELRKNIEYYKGLRWGEVNPIIGEVFKYCEEE